MEHRMIDPEFVPGEGWFLGDVSAPTIARLLNRLGPFYRVNNYYPNGVVVARAERDGTTMMLAKLPPIEHKPPIFIVKAKSHRSANVEHAIRGKYNAIRDEVLDMWAAGTATHMIAERFNLTMVKIAAHIVAPARDKGDPRAVRRGSVRRYRNFSRTIDQS